MANADAYPAKFLYLTKPEWAARWVDGGDVPIRKASVYRSAERRATLTLDETQLRQGQNIDGDDADLVGTKIVGPGKLRAVEIWLPGGKILRDVDLDSAVWDGHILCFSNSQSKTLCKRLGKRACVRIADPQTLFDDLSRQLGVSGSIRECEYTREVERSVFVKSYRDAWQDEFRMFWSVGRDVDAVQIPAGTGRLLWTL